VAAEQAQACAARGAAAWLSGGYPPRGPQTSGRGYLTPRELPAAPPIFEGREDVVRRLREKLDAQ
jgi:hypothetical protein